MLHSAWCSWCETSQIVSIGGMMLVVVVLVVLHHSVHHRLWSWLANVHVLLLGGGTTTTTATNWLGCLQLRCRLHGTQTKVSKQFEKTSKLELDKFNKLTRLSQARSLW